MNVDNKSMFLGIAIGLVSVLVILFLVGDVETKFSIQMGEDAKSMNKEIDVRIEKTVEDGNEITNVTVSGSGSVTKEDLDKELERLFEEHGIDKTDSNIKIEMKINS
jgi:flagellar biosynthesis/type III secretory pathway M-ring protein FliF/YscJ